VRGEDRQHGLFAMTYLDPNTHPVWKEELRDGRVDLAFTAQVGRRLGRIHASTAGDPAVANEFATDATFHAIRVEPYLEATAQAHPQIAAQLMALSSSTLNTRRALVHGDVSPKNVLVSSSGPIFLDAECAWYGDPAFDVAFCLKHFFLKCLWRPQFTAEYMAAYDRFVDAYLDCATWESKDGLEARIARLLPALFLGRADGKSPVEYITKEGKQRVRRVAVPLIAEPVTSLDLVKARWWDELRAVRAHA
jgi:aminoglycoside phosphotransferase (APT) family kinase protein